MPVLAPRTAPRRPAPPCAGGAGASSNRSAAASPAAPRAPDEDLEAADAFDARHQKLSKEALAALFAMHHGGASPRPWDGWHSAAGEPHVLGIARHITAESRGCACAEGRRQRKP